MIVADGIVVVYIGLFNALLNGRGALSPYYRIGSAFLLVTSLLSLTFHFSISIMTSVRSAGQTGSALVEEKANTSGSMAARNFPPSATVLAG